MIKGWYKLAAIMPPSPEALAIRDRLSRRVDELDENGVKIGDFRHQEFLSGFNAQPGGKFGATYVTDNLQDIDDAWNEPSITGLFVQDLGNGLHLGETYITVNIGTEKDPVYEQQVIGIYEQQVIGAPTYTPHPAFEIFMIGGLTKAQAIYVNRMLGTPPV